MDSGRVAKFEDDMVQALKDAEAFIDEADKLPVEPRMELFESLRWLAQRLRSLVIDLEAVPC